MTASATGRPVGVADDDALRHIVSVANGDVRMALNALELAARTTPTTDGSIHITLPIAEDSIQKPVIRCDETLFYDMLSAFVKACAARQRRRAAVVFRLLHAGADPSRWHASSPTPVSVGMANPGHVAGGGCRPVAEMIGMRRPGCR